MKGILRRTLFNAFGLFVVSTVISGFNVYGGVQTFIIAGFLLSLISLIIRPILTILTLPLNMATFGTFSFLINAIILYILTVLVPQISVNAFVFRGANFIGFVIPRIEFNSFFAYIACALLLSLIISFINWLIK